MSERTITSIWLNESCEHDSAVYVCLCKLDPYLVTFCDTDQCIDFITKMEEGVEGEVLLIVSVEMFSTPAYGLLQLCEELTQIDSVYILHPTKMDFAAIFATFTKVRGVYQSSEALYKFVNSVFSIRRHRRDEYIHDGFIISSLARPTATISTNIIDSQHLSSASIDKQEVEFMYSRFLQEILIRIESTREEMVDFCQEKYAGTKKDLEMIEQFKLYYIPDHAIFWYTRDIFLFHLLNTALREQDIDTLYSLRYFIKDLFLLLKERFLAGRWEQSIEIVYRGQLMSSVEFSKKIRYNTGGFFSVNSFFSTTLNRDLAVLYAGNGTRPNEESVLFEIEIDNDDIRAAYTNVSPESVFGDSETEVLFAIGAVFRINSVKKNEDNIWIVKSKLTDDEDENLRKLTNHLKEEIITSNRLVSLARLLYHMAYYEKAEKYYYLVLQDPTVIEDSRWLSTLYEELGSVYYSSNQYEKAIEYYKMSLEIDLQSHPATDIKFIGKYSNLGCIYLAHGTYDEAASTMNKATEIARCALDSDPSVVESLANNIANLYRKITRDPERFELYETRKVLQDNLKSILHNNSHSLSLGNDIGNIFYVQQNYSEAHEMYKQCLDNQLRFYPPNHPRIAETYHNIAVAYYAQRDYGQAVEFFEKELKIQETAHQSDYSDLATTYNNLAWSYYMQGQLEASLKFWQKKYDNDLKNFPTDHPNIDEDLKWITQIAKELSEML